MISKLRRDGQISFLHYCPEAVHHYCPVSFIGCLKPWHEDIELRKQSPCAFLDNFRVSVLYAKIVECIRHELL